MRIGAVGFAGFCLAVALAAIFSGSVMAPITAVPVAIATGGLAGYLAVKVIDQ